MSSFRIERVAIGIALVACGGGGSSVKPATSSTPATLPVVRPAAPSCPTGMIAIPAGTFTMGNAPPNARAVTLAAYCIDATEVTVAAYRACVDANGCSVASDDSNEHPDAPGLRLCNTKADDRLDHPINCVTWIQAAAYCAWQRARLPAEAEWEYAARGSDGRAYPWGSDAPTDARANYRQVELAAHMRGTQPVGSHPTGASPRGALDMAGNVAEWVNDGSGVTREIRGGSWQDMDASGVDAIHRIAADEATDLPYVGFRCARDPR